MQFAKFKIFHLLLAILIIACLLAMFVEQQSVVGRSTSHSPDGTWCLNLKLVEYSTFFTSRKVLDAAVKHSTNKDWDVSTSIPLDEADANTISNQDQNHPIAWSADSSTVSYWINKKLKDTITIEANEEQFKFTRELYSLSVTHSAAKKDE